MIRVIAFDLSGTLIDEEPYFEKADKIDEKNFKEIQNSRRS